MLGIQTGRSLAVRRVALAVGFSCACPILAVDLLTRLEPSTVTAAAGAVRQISIETARIVLEPGALTQHGQGSMRHYRFHEPVWLIGYRTEVIEDSGAASTENNLCHTFLGDQMVDQNEDREFSGFFSDFFTDEVRLPDGFGLYFDAGQNIHWMTMFNHRGSQPKGARMRATLYVIREAERRRPISRLYAALRSVSTPHLYFVPPGTHEKSATFDAPFTGTVRFVGSHLHPYGSSIELVKESGQQVVWRGIRQTDGHGAIKGTGPFLSAPGYRMQAGEKFRLRAVYENTSNEPVDAMAGVYLFYSRD